MKILVTGANGQLGEELQIQFRKSNIDCVATDLPELDITDRKTVQRNIAEFKPALVINTAAYTDVDRAETEMNPAFRINEDGPANLARACEDTGIPMIHISTDYVFDGKKNAPYVESDPLSPIGVYARSKAAGEKKVRSLLSEHLIIRTSWLYGVYGHNFVKTMLRLGKEKKELQVVNDQFGTPTCAGDLARAIMEIVSLIQADAAIKWGTYHYTGKGVANWHQFAEQIFDITDRLHLFDLPRLEPVPSTRYPAAAKRPPYSVLDCSLIQKEFGIYPKSWQKSLETTIQRIINHDNR